MVSLAPCSALHVHNLTGHFTCSGGNCCYYPCYYHLFKVVQVVKAELISRPGLISHSATLPPEIEGHILIPVLLVSGCMKKPI